MGIKIWFYIIGEAGIPSSSDSKQYQLHRFERMSLVKDSVSGSNAQNTTYGWFSTIHSVMALMAAFALAGFGTTL